MSSQRGNVVRSRPQKYKNSMKFENDKYECSKETKALNNKKFEWLCNKCESIIQWKIRYKKYKQLTVPTKCIKCGGKTVKAAYHNICISCVEVLNVCAKCGEQWRKEVIEEANRRIENSS